MTISSMTRLARASLVCLAACGSNPGTGIDEMDSSVQASGADAASDGGWAPDRREGGMSVGTSDAGSDARVESPSGSGLGGPDGGDAGGGGRETDAVEPAPAAAIEEPNTPCETELAKACDGHNATTKLICDDGKWRYAGTCDESTRCDTRPGAQAGTCQPVVPACLGQAVGDSVCSEGERKTCGIDLLDAEDQPCSENATCVSEDQVASCVCDAGYESDGQGGCQPPIDECADNPCFPGKCTDGLLSYTCECPEGYEAGEGCIDLDECSDTNLCDPDYPCVETEVPGYVCLGQRAEWPMPDSVEGSLVKPSYETSVDVVTDRVTGLMWTRKPLAACDVGGGACSRAKAVEACREASVGGHDDWRLPGKIEIESLIDDVAGLGGPAIATAVFEASADGKYGSTWSASTQHTADASPPAWYVDFETGRTRVAGVEKVMRARCVRSTGRLQSLVERYSQGRIPPIVDGRTGLAWLMGTEGRQCDGQFCTVVETLDRCPRALPTKKELLTALDPAKEIAAGMRDSLLAMYLLVREPQTSRVWTSTSAGPGEFWYVDMNDGTTGTASVSEPYDAFCTMDPR